MHPLASLAQKLTKKCFSNALRVGKYFVYDPDGKAHKQGRPIFITSGQFLSGGCLSNFWCWRYVRPDGNLSNKEGSGYGGSEKYFRPISKQEAIALAKSCKKKRPKKAGKKNGRQ